MVFKTPYIEYGFGLKWPTETLLLSLTQDRELGEAEWWRRMAALIHVAAKSSDSDLMEALDAAKKARWGSGFPQVEVTTPQNLAPSPQSASPEPACLLVEADAPEKCFKIVNDFVRPAIQETQVQSLGQEDPLEKGMATHSSFLAWRIPWTEEPGRLQSMRSQRVRHN